MATPAQYAANIANSTKSTGPRTDSGKYRVSGNSITHGLRSTRVVLPNEDPAAFEEFAHAILDRHMPVNEDERDLAVAVAASEWRLIRAWRAHDHLIAAATEIETSERGVPVDPAGVINYMLLNPGDQNRFKLILRYLRATERAHQAALTALAKAQKARLATTVAEPERPEPAEVPHHPDCPNHSANPEVAEPDTAAEPADHIEPQQLPRAERRAFTRASRKAARKAAAAAAAAAARQQKAAA